jgi:hypothetical protein
MLSSPSPTPLVSSLSFSSDKNSVGISYIDDVCCMPHLYPITVLAEQYEVRGPLSFIRNLNTVTLSLGFQLVPSTSSRPALGFTQPPTQWVSVAFPRGKGKAADTWIWPLASIWCWDQECVERYLHSPICRHGVVLNKLSARTTLPS